MFVRFNGFFDEHSTQETLYHNSVCPLIPFVLQGQNATVFAYGPTGAGKKKSGFCLKSIVYVKLQGGGEPGRKAGHLNLH